MQPYNWVVAYYTSFASFILRFFFFFFSVVVLVAVFTCFDLFLRTFVFSVCIKYYIEYNGMELHSCVIIHFEWKKKKKKTFNQANCVQNLQFSLRFSPHKIKVFTGKFRSITNQMHSKHAMEIEEKRKKTTLSTFAHAAKPFLSVEHMENKVIKSEWKKNHLQQQQWFQFHFINSYVIHFLFLLYNALLECVITWWWMKVFGGNSQFNDISFTNMCVRAFLCEILTLSIFDVLFSNFFPRYIEHTQKNICKKKQFVKNIKSLTMDIINANIQILTKCIQMW